MVAFLKKNITIFIIAYIWLSYVGCNILHLDFLDELYAVLSLGILFILPQKGKKEFWFFFIIMVAYAIYSLILGVNRESIAIFKDWIQQIKPFAFFYLFYYLAPYFNAKDRKNIKTNILLAGICFLCSALLYGVESGRGLINLPLSLGVSAFSFATCYYYFSCKDTSKNLLITLFLLSSGLLCARTKFYGEYVVALACFFFVKKRIRFNTKYVFACTILGIVLFYVAISEFRFYFVDSRGAARFLMYANMPKVLIDYIPFGPGFATFATHASGEYYSPLYGMYGIERGYGMSPDNYSYISDTYFPVLAQFGIVGVCLFIWFWIRRYKEIRECSNINVKNYKIGLVIVAMVMIESVAGPVLVMNWNFIPMMLLGLVCHQGKINETYYDQKHVKSLIKTEKSSQGIEP